MPYSDESYNLRIDLDTEHCELSPAELSEIERSLEPLRRVAEDLPVSDLHINIVFSPRSRQYHVSMSLILPKRRLFTGEYDPVVHPAVERCVHKLVAKLKTAKELMGEKPAREKQQQGTLHEVVPAGEPDAGALAQAVEWGDYRAFREATGVYEEAVRRRAARWIERYPELVSDLGETLTLDDVVEDVFLTAFDSYDQRPSGVRLGRWLEEVIDQSLRAIAAQPDLERENIELARTLEGLPPVE